MKYRWGSISATGAAVLFFLAFLSPATGRAASVTFDLNKALIGGAVTALPYGATSYGTVTLSDYSGDAKEIQFDIQFKVLPSGAGGLDPSTWKALTLRLNYDLGVLPGYKFQYENLAVLGTWKDVTYLPDLIVASGSGNMGAFDLALPKNGNLGGTNSGQYHGVLRLGNGTALSDLDPDFFDVTDSFGLFAAVHSSNGGLGGQSIALGSTQDVPIPEPGTMVLLGSGLVGLAGWGRKKFRK